MGLPKVKDADDNELVLVTGPGANGILGFTILKPNGTDPKNLSGLTIKMRIMDSAIANEIVAPITGSITDAPAGEIEFDMLLIDILADKIQTNAVIVFLNSTSAEEVGERVRANIEEGGND